MYVVTSKFYEVMKNHGCIIFQKSGKDTGRTTSWEIKMH